MKKVLFVVGVSLLVLTGCGKKDELLGKWKTTYELGMYEEVEQTYEFKKNKSCIKTLKTDQKIEVNCKYKVNDNKIEVEYDDGKKTTLTYRKEDKDLVIDGYKYKKQK